MVKKRAKKKSAGKPKKPKAAPRPLIGDRSRLDTKPLQEHLRRRIKELQSAEAPAVGNEQRIARLQVALDTLMDICYPTMDIPI